MQDLQALLNQYAADTNSAIDSIDAQFATAHTQHETAMAKHRENATRYATPVPPTPLALNVAVRTGDRSFTCTDVNVIAAAARVHMRSHC